MSWKTKRVWKKISAERRKNDFRKTDYQVFQSIMAKLVHEIEKQKALEAKEKAEIAKKNRKKTIRQTAEEQMEETT